MTTATVPVNYGKKSLNLSNLDKVLYPETGTTKSEVIRYYASIAPAILPHLRRRPLTLKRYPNGVTGKFFYEKRCPSHKPEWVPTVPVWSEHLQGKMYFCSADDEPTLVWVANLASLELHTLLSRADDVSRPTMIALDMDPGAPADVFAAAEVAFILKDILDKQGLESFVKTSGSKGLHMYIPLNTTKVSFDDTKAFAHELADRLMREQPDRVTSNMRKDLRVGKVFVDWSQNDIHKTTVCVYSLRARAHPTVSTPVTWDELKRALKKRDARLLTFEYEDTLKRVEQKGDLFEPVLKLKQKLPS